MQNSDRVISFTQAICEATEQMMEQDPSVYVIGEGVPDPKKIFGTTAGLLEKFGPERVMDMPVAENGMTGIALGSALVGFRPILVHQRIDFSLYAFDQVVNNIAKWYSMFAGQQSAPIVIRAIIGQGWGQGNQHSQNLQSLYSHIPGLKVVMPSNAADCKGLMISAIQDNNPVIFLEHRWLHNTTSIVPIEPYSTEIGRAKISRKGTDITLVSWSYWLLESLRAAQFLQDQGVSVEVVDIRSLRPLDYNTIRESVAKTGRLLVVDGSWKQGSFAGEIIARVAEDSEVKLTTNPKRLTFPDFPSPSTPGLTKYYYPTLDKIFLMAAEMMNKKLNFQPVEEYMIERIHDVPDAHFKGPF